MSNWQKQLKYDPIPSLLDSDDQALQYFVKRDLLQEQVPPISTVWQLPEVQKILKKQQSDGSWKYTGKKDPDNYPAYHYPLVETWKQFRFLVDKYEMDRTHEGVQKAAEYLFSCQTGDGDIRGFIGNQYATYYTGAMLGLLIKAGYTNDPRVEHGLHWLLSMRQEDGGWTIPILTADISWDEQMKLTSRFAEPIEPDRTMPFSHNWTGMILRAFVVHPDYRHTEAARTAAYLLKSRFFQPDVYNSYKSADYWTRFQFPFWWNHLVAALDSLSLLGIPKEDQQIKQGLQWLIDFQQPDGLWKTSYGDGKKESTAGRTNTLWTGLAVCRIFSRFWGE